MSVAEPQNEPPLSWLVTHKPLAALTKLSNPTVLFLAGACAGALGKTLTAPLDRLKIIMQVKGSMVGGAVREAAMKGSVLRAFIEIGRHGGVRSYWRGNLPQVLRVLPYSAAQLGSYELLKGYLADKQGHLSVECRLLCGAGAGMVSTLVTYPLDTLRMRLALDTSLRSIPKAVMALFREAGPSAFFRGLGPAMIGIAPYMAIELATYDSLPQQVPSFVRGFGAALLATCCCYPLDTVRRQIQICSTQNISMFATIRKVYHSDGVAGFYRGFLPNALKNLPNKGIRLSVFSNAKSLMVESKKARAEADEQWRQRRLQGCKSAATKRKAQSGKAKEVVAASERPDGVSKQLILASREPLLAASTSLSNRRV